ncbi:HNH endonuclease signature motif containing protein [Agreia sp. Leaf283]|uniref:HNH endonuclease signature motif containing protein n=1 Tax=Agreia sp. Leaf283 TaxID=1736321 RepID=UPI0006F7F3EF|nr:HNH endonuclease signature motif containing protein [Agreia sp. Leaf283]KQP56653.1 hypothetical protein ASF51_01670 [Agreia sp. Leaf283]
MSVAASLRHEVDRALACGAAEINQRSRRELGGAGLAKTEGHLNPQSMIAALTGSTKADARKIDNLGKSVMQASPVRFAPPAGQADAGVPQGPWFASITERMQSGEISPDRFEALRAGLGGKADDVSPEALAAAADRILEYLHPLDAPELVYRDARNARALLDRESVAENEREMQARQEAKIWTDRDGMVHLRASFAPEDGAWFKNTLDLLLGPRIGGPRLVHGKAATMAKALEDDPRTTEQIRASVLVALLKAGALVDENALLAQKRPTVQVVVRADELTRPNSDGVAFIEGTGIPVSMKTIDRLVCDTGIVPVIVDSAGAPLDLGREVRLFTAKQRLAIASLQGGCVVAGCNAPPSFCEVHHIDPWSEGGKTDVEDGVLLCRFHHMHLHNHGHRIARIAGERYKDSYRWVPSAEVDPLRSPIRVRFRGVALHYAHASGIGSASARTKRNRPRKPSPSAGTVRFTRRG